ncbi:MULTISPECIES: PAAR domain-containing protein [unclassified Pseudomonas]|uniref:PAAR domain-containing protein n=1 Tax=unclassified Pseudomonas TaxID=196821 RepID=UPI0030DAEA7E
MKGIIRIGDKTTGGGTVLSGSVDMVFRGRGAARQGDPVDCPIAGHGRTMIAEGHPVFRDNGVSVAFHGHLCVCGCALISSLPEAGATS